MALHRSRLSAWGRFRDIRIATGRHELAPRPGRPASAAASICDPPRFTSSSGHACHRRRSWVEVAESRAIKLFGKLRSAAVHELRGHQRDGDHRGEHVEVERCGHQLRGELGRRAGDEFGDHRGHQRDGD